jgi:uncharacterized protein YbaR (Trm112 family)
MNCPSCKNPLQLVKKERITVWRDSHGYYMKEEQGLFWCIACKLHIWKKVEE